MAPPAVTNAKQFQDHSIQPMGSKVTSTILVSAAGQKGTNGTQSWGGSSQFRATYGSGRDGSNATYPTPGSHGGDVRMLIEGCSTDGLISMKRLDNRSSSAKLLTVSPIQDLLIDCRGGDGGRGGNGEDGQAGSEGARGVDASQIFYVSSGGPGGNGGDAGRGTSGANGGDGGRVYIEVGEEDMDTLLALAWDVGGGYGGTRGRHGRPGAGGLGGQGGARYTWREIGFNNQTAVRNYPADSRGADGRACNLPLSDGQWGSDGHCEIKLRRKGGGKDEVYPGRYHLVLRSFDVVDENEDGINEPGEFLLVKNILVQNIGRMPSPRVNPLCISIRETSWLEPDMHQLLEIPLNIPPRATVRVPGSLRALIRNERHPRSSGVPFRAEDAVSLEAFSPRLKRRVPEFEGSRSVVYEYPLVMRQPRFLEAVAIGDRVKFSWEVRSKSLKPVRNAATPRRQFSTLVSNLDGTFNLSSTSSGEEESCPVEVLERVSPGGRVVICQHLTVSVSAKAFSVGTIKVQLFLPDPHNKSRTSAREVVYFDLRVQVSPRYRHNPLANFLVVVNCAVERQKTEHLMDFIEHILHLRADILNLSLVGSLAELDEKDRSSLLSCYKTVLVYANSFEYFQDGTRNPWDLMDPWEVSRLAAAGTSFLFLSLSQDNNEPLNRWLRQVVLPAREFTHTLPLDTSVKDPKEILRQLEEHRPGVALPGDHGEHEVLPTLVVKQGIFTSSDSKAASKAKSVQRILAKQLPLRRLLVSHFVDPSVPEQSVVALSEGLPHEAQVIVFNSPQSPATPTDSSLVMALVVLSMPYPDRCRIFWNMVTAGNSPGTGMKVRAAYGGDDLRHLRGGGHHSNDGKMVDSKVFELITWSVTNQITSEISRFCHRAPWRDRLSDTYLLSQLPLLATFLDTAPPPSYSPLSVESLRILSAVLAPVLGVSAPISLGNWLRQNVFHIRTRKQRTRNMLRHVFDRLFDTLYAYGPDEHRKLTKAKTAAKNMLLKEEAAAKKALARIKKNNSAFTIVERAHEFCVRWLGDIANVPRGTSAFNDLSQVEKRSAYLSRHELDEQRSQHEGHLAKIKRDAALSESMLSDMVT